METVPMDAKGRAGEGACSLRRGRGSQLQPRNFDDKFPFGVETNACLDESTGNKQNGSRSHPESEYSSTLGD